MPHFCKRPKFGNLEEIFDKRQFLKAVDEVPKSTYVVIHLYKDVNSSLIFHPEIALEYFMLK